MRLDEILFAGLTVAIIANLLLLIWVALKAREEPRPTKANRTEPYRPRDPDMAAADTPTALSPAGGPRDPADARAAAAIEAFVSGVSADARGEATPPAPAELISRLREASAEPARAPELELREADQAPAGLVDAATWNRTLQEESARAARFGRPAAVVMAELPHLDRFADRFGEEVARQIVEETAHVLVTEGRDTRFGVLLVETDEQGAPRYVDRVRAAADGWLESAGLSIRLSLGWASPTDGGDVIAAAATADERMREAGRLHGPD
jgi:GGDEF domain-containing protein